MAIIRSKKQQNYSVIDNQVFEDNRLSFEAIGLLCKVLSKPDNWTISVKNLVNSTQNTRKESGEKVIYAILNELIEKGFVIRKKRQDGKVDYTVYDTPQTQTAESANSQNGKQPKQQTAESANSQNGDHNKYGIKLINTDIDLINTDIPASHESEAETCDFENHEKPKRKTKKQTDVDFLIENGFDRELATQWVNVRHSKGATTIEKIALTRFLNEVEKSKLPLNQILELCIENNWRSFKAEWLENRATPPNGWKPQTSVKTVPTHDNSKSGLAKDVFAKFRNKKS